jgi:hypothetical protein
VVVAVKKKPGPPPPPPPPPEPDLPKHLPQALFCPVPSEVQPGVELAIRCAVRPALVTKSVVFQYRPSGTDHFVTTDAIRSPKGWYVAKIRGTEVKGNALQFFAQAYNANNRVAASNGTDESPNIVLIRKATADQAVVDDDPLSHIHNQIAAENALKNEGRRSPAETYWAGMGMGTGWGWFPTRTPEGYPNAKVKGWAFGGVLHILPEIGYQWTKNIMFSLQGRYQFVHTDRGSGCGNGGCPTPHSGAWAVLARGYLLSDALFGRASNLQIFGTGTFGVGSAFRLYVPPHPNSNPDIDFKTSDTVSGGPVVLGVGGGLVYNFTNYFALAAEARALFGFWHVAMVIEGALSARLALWTPGARRAPEVKPETELPPETNPDFPPD